MIHECATIRQHLSTLAKGTRKWESANPFPSAYHFQPIDNNRANITRKWQVSLVFIMRHISLMIIGFTNRQLSSTCNLSFLEKVHLEVFENNYLVNVSWLQVIYNVKTMTLSPSTLEILLTVRFMICLYFLF